MSWRLLVDQDGIRGVPNTSALKLASQAHPRRKPRGVSLSLAASPTAIFHFSRLCEGAAPLFTSRHDHEEEPTTSAHHSAPQRTTSAHHIGVVFDMVAKNHLTVLRAAKAPLHYLLQDTPRRGTNHISVLWVWVQETPCCCILQLLNRLAILLTAVISHNEIKRKRNCTYMLQFTPVHSGTLQYAPVHSS